MPVQPGAPVWIARALGAGFLLLVLALVGVLATAERSEHAEAASVRTSEVRLAIDRLHDSLTEMQTTVRGYMITPGKELLQSYRRALADVEPANAALRRLTSDSPEQSRRLDRIDPITARLISIYSEKIAAVRAGGGGSARRIEPGESTQLMNQAHAELAAMDAEELRLLDARNAQVHRDRRVLLYAIALAIAVSLAVGAGGIAAIRRYVRSLEQANSALGAEIAIREATETQLRQAQKMDALGQLTGGVAHDFNNMLAIIVGSLDLMLRRLGREGDPKLRELAGGALEGAKRAGALTKRLLAFSRQLPLELRAIDVNRIVAELSVVFERTIGAPIEIHTLLAGGLWPAFADQPQLESAILNLVVNARDAIGGSSGKITLETANARLDEAYAAAHPGVEAGEYVMLAVTDTGSGMSPDVLARAFDPFFSTKPKGAGTGLGLSQVHGFIRQSGGHVNISSELGQGTTVKLYLPRHTGPATGEIAQAPPRSDVSRAHTVLVAEDESDMRAFTAEALKELGCSVVEAENTQDALEKLDANPDVDLLLTDIMMPGEDGRELANAALRRKPDLKVIYITGYTPSAMVDDQAFDRDTHLLSKPFTLAQLELKIRNVFGA